MSAITADPAIEVVVFDGWRAVARAEADSPEAAIFAGQTLYDEAKSGTYGQKLTVGFYVDGKLAIRADGRPR